MVDYNIKGSCNRCGRCCIKFIDWRMSIKDPTKKAPPQLEKDNVRCYYLEGTIGSSTTCRIMSGDVKVADLPAFHKWYYESECLPYPDVKDEAHWDKTDVTKIGYLSGDCSVGREKKVG